MFTSRRTSAGTNCVKKPSLERSVRATSPWRSTVISFVVGKMPSFRCFSPRTALITLDLPALNSPTITRRKSSSRPLRASTRRSISSSAGAAVSRNATARSSAERSRFENLKRRAVDELTREAPGGGSGRGGDVPGAVARGGGGVARGRVRRGGIRPVVSRVFVSSAFPSLFPNAPSAADRAGRGRNGERVVAPDPPRAHLRERLRGRFRVRDARRRLGVDEREHRDGEFPLDGGARRRVRREDDVGALLRGDEGGVGVPHRARDDARTAHRLARDDDGDAVVADDDAVRLGGGADVGAVGDEERCAAAERRLQNERRVEEFARRRGGAVRLGRGENHRGRARGDEGLDLGLARRRLGGGDGDDGAGDANRGTFLRREHVPGGGGGGGGGGAVATLAALTAAEEAADRARGEGGGGGAAAGAAARGAGEEGRVAIRDPRERRRRATWRRTPARSGDRARTRRGDRGARRRPARADAGRTPSESAAGRSVEPTMLEAVVARGRCGYGRGREGGIATPASRTTIRAQSRERSVQEKDRPGVHRLEETTAFEIPLSMTIGQTRRVGFDRRFVKNSRSAKIFPVSEHQHPPMRFDVRRRPFPSPFDAQSGSLERGRVALDLPEAKAKLPKNLTQAESNPQPSDLESDALQLRHRV